MIYTCPVASRPGCGRLGLSGRNFLPFGMQAGYFQRRPSVPTHVFGTKSMQLARNLRQNSLNNCYSENLSEVIAFPMAVVARYALRALAKVNSQLSVCVMLKRRFLQM